MNTPVYRRFRLGAALSMGGLVVLAATACGSHTPTHGSAGPAVTSAAPKATVLTGTTLNSLLLPASAMPKGFRLNADGARNTGDSITPRSSSHVAPGKVCGMLMQTSWIRAAGIGSTAFAQNDYGDAGHTNQFAQEIDTFHADDARKAMSKLSKAFAGCTAFTDKSNGQTAKVKLVRSTLPGAGDGGIKAVTTSPTWKGGMTLAAIRVGHSVVTTFYSSSHNDKGAAAVKMAERLAKKVQSVS